MFFKFKNFGSVNSGSIELGDLTIIAGPNNIGKTYLNYTIYGMLKEFHDHVPLDIDKIQITRLLNDGVLQINLRDYEEKYKDILEGFSQNFTKSLPSFFSVNKQFFAHSHVEFGMNKYQVDESEFEGVTSLGKSSDKPILRMNKDTKDHVLTIVAESDALSELPEKIILDIVNGHLSHALFQKTILDPFVITSERTGIALFYKELDLNKNRLLEMLADSSQENFEPYKLLGSMRSHYATPINDNIDVIRSYEKISAKSSFLVKDKSYSHILNLLSDLLGGSYHGAGDVLTYVKKDGDKEVAIPFYLASSSIKSLLLLDIYIKHLAKKNGILIIDEPELNLHPDNQRKIAKLLARLVNAGIKVVITTHSDYIIREINNYIMLSNKVVNSSRIMKKAEIRKEDILEPRQVKAYSINNQKIESLKVSKYGINMDLFDNIINSANTLATDIYFNIKEE